MCWSSNGAVKPLPKREMKRLKDICGIALISLVILLASCDKQDYDPLEPGLPQYSQNGNNSVGAIINGLLWRRFSSFLYLGARPSMSVEYDTLSGKSRVTFGANLVIGEEDTQYASVYFNLNNQVIQSEEDLYILSQSELKIDGISVDAGIKTNHFGNIDCQNNRQIFGSLFLRHIGPSIIQDTLSVNVCSGTFGFTITSECGEINVLRGRFDYMMGQVHFIQESL